MPAKRRIRIPEIVGDIRSRMTDSELMEKYSLSAKGLESLFKTILDAGIMQASEIYERLPSYDHSVDLEDLRLLPRRDLELRIRLFDQTQPQVRGLLSDLTEKGFRVREVEAKVAEVRTFVIPADELFPIDPIVLEARCRWVKKEAGGSSEAGFEITDVSRGNLGALLSLIQSSTREKKGRSDVNRFIDDGEDTTETVDLTSVFTENVTESGSFSFTGVKRTWFGKLIQALPVPALLIDQSYNITFANQSWTRLCGNYRKLEGKPFSSLFPNPWVADEAESVAEKVFSTRKRGTGQALLQIDKSRIWGRLHFRSVRMGTARSLLILVEDLTPEKEQLLAEQKHTEELSREIVQRIQAEQELGHEKQKFEFVSEYAPVGMVMIGENGEFQYINRKFKELFGYELTEIPTGRDWFRKAYPDPRYRHEAISSWIEGFKKSEPGEALAKMFTVKCKDGREKITRFRAAKLDTGQYVMTCEDVTDRKRAEEALRESEQRYRTLLGTMNEGLVLEDENGVHVYANDRFAKMLAYSGDEVIGRSNLDFVHEDSRKQVELEIAKRRPGESGAYETTLRDKEGNRVHVIVSVSPLIGHEGRFQGKVAVFTDITDRIQSEEALRESEERYRQMADNSLMGVFIQEYGPFSYVNDRLAEMFGYRPEEMIGRHVLDFVHPDDRELVYSERVKRIHGRDVPTQYECRALRKDGGFKWIEIYAARIQFQGRSVIMGNVTDITHRKKAEEARRQSEEKYRQLADVTFEAILFHDKGVLLEANDQFYEMLGFEPDELLGTEMLEKTISPESLEVVKEHIASGSTEGYEAIGKRKDGTTFPVEISVRLREVEGRQIRAVALRDISERREMERQLVEAQKMEAIGTLAGGIAHDFNNLLQVVVGYTELVLSQKDSTDPDHEDLRVILKAAARGGELVKSILAFSRKAETKARPVNLNHEMEQAHRLMERTLPKMIGTELHLADDLKTVNADPTQMEQVLLNLAVNSRDAMPDGGRLIIETENVFLDEEYCRRNLEVKPGHYVRMTVSDTGCGMPREVVDHIFEPFYTTKEVGEGTGLGLSAVFGIVKSHGGHIACYSEPGSGTTFRIDIPVLEAEIDSAVEDEGEAPPSGTETLLVVDDEEHIRELARRYLSRAGYKILMAGNGVEALRVYRENQSNISLVILDLIMPEMGGSECLKELLEINPNVKVLIASGFSPKGTTREALEAGAKGFVDKPFRVKEMFNTIREVLDEQ